MKESAAAAGRDSTRAKATATAVPKSTSLYPSPSCGSVKEKGSTGAGVKTDAAKQGLETTSATRMRQGRRAKEVGSISNDSKASELPADDTVKAVAQKTNQTDSTRGKAAPTSAKPSVNLRESQVAAKEPQSPKKRVTGAGDSTDDSTSLPSRGS